VDENDDEGRNNSLRDLLRGQQNSREKFKFTISGIAKFSITDKPGLSMLSRMRHTSYIQEMGINKESRWIHRDDRVPGSLHTARQTPP
jgi:hypothetical protein